MKAYIVTKGVIDRLHTHKLFKAAGIDYTWVTHARPNAKRIEEIDDAPIILSHAPDLVTQRNFLLDKIIPDGEWYIGADDNIQKLTMVHPSLYLFKSLDVGGPVPKGFTSWREVYRAAFPIKSFGLVMEALRRSIEKNKTIYGGFASNENPMFRKNHYGYRRFVKSKLYVLRNTPGARFKGVCGHDSYLSAYVVAHYGKVVVNTYIHPVANWYEAGGLGKLEERRAHLERSMANTMAEFPGLVAKASGPNSALKFLRTSDAAVANWQRQHKANSH
jgi:hypothetical protein